VSHVRAGRAPSAAVVAIVVALGLASLAFAQVPDEDAWTVQTIALRDLREAQATAEELRDHGFPAYTEFAMHEGRQWVRVRVGCWVGRDGAEAIVELLRGLVTREATAVPLSPGAPVACVDIDVGFIKPSRFLALHALGEMPTYRVEVAEHVAHVRHDGEGWRVSQGESEPDPLPAPIGSLRFRAGELRGFAVVLLDDGIEATVFCPGRLVAQVGDVAVVEWANAIVACVPYRG
jgi:hypothetical protein